MTKHFENRKYLSQKEVVERLGLSPGTVKRLREEGYLPYLQPPGSSRILCPIEGIDNFEKQFLKQAKEVVKKPNKPGIKREKSIITETQTRWRI